MRVLEFQAKRLFQDIGIPTPHGVVLRSTDDASAVEFPAVLKAQVPVGGRGKAGGIRVVKCRREAEDALCDLRALSIKGYPVRVVLAEQERKVEREVYFAILIHRGLNAPMVLASRSGGMDIEELARRDPRAIVRLPIDLCLGPTEHGTRSLALQLGLESRVNELRTIVGGAFELFRDLDATLVEINPLGVSSAGLVALDAKLSLDDKAGFRRADLFDELRAEQADAVAHAMSASERVASDARLTYVALDGNIALISDGAGTGMLALDLIHDAGGRAACFCELGALGDARGIQTALDAVLANDAVRVVLVSLIGGLTRMDEIAEGIYAFRTSHPGMTPTVVRMVGTKEEEGRRILARVGIAAYDDLPAAVGQAVSLAKEDRCRSS
ncbi:MAG: succinate--CoA ligase subunit beta [Thermotogota bacterium]